LELTKVLCSIPSGITTTASAPRLDHSFSSRSRPASTKSTAEDPHFSITAGRRVHLEFTFRTIGLSQTGGAAVATARKAETSAIYEKKTSTSDKIPLCSC
jgi:hypothetical protein